METELFEERRWADGDLGLALIRDGNGTRSFETLMRYRGAAMAEFMRALRTQRALQAEQARPIQEDLGSARRGDGAIARVPLSARAIPDEPGPNQPEPGGSGRKAITRATANGPEPSLTLHEPAARWTPKEAELRGALDEAGASCTPSRPGGDASTNEPETRSDPGGITAQAAPKPVAPQRRERIAGELPSARTGGAAV